MKNIVTLPVNFLRIYPTERDVTSPNGVKGKRIGALVLRANLPKSAAQKDANAIELSAKQLDNLASMHGIRATGRKGWSQLQTLVGVGKSACVVSAEEHQKDDKYVDPAGVEQTYKQTSTNCGLDSIVLPDKVTSAMIAKTIDAIINYEEEDAIDKILNGNGGGVLEPALEGVK